MLFQIATIFCAAMAMAVSIPVARQVNDAAMCTLVLTPQSPVTPSTNLLAEFNLRMYIYDY